MGLSGGKGLGKGQERGCFAEAKIFILFNKLNRMANVIQRERKRGGERKKMSDE